MVDEVVDCGSCVGVIAIAFLVVSGVSCLDGAYDYLD